MELNVEATQNLALQGPKEDSSNLPLTAKITELKKMKEDLKRAKDDAMQSWLDSRPLIDELENMQADLASVEARVSKADLTISELQAKLETTETRIKSIKEEEQKSRMMINDKNQALHKTQEEMEQLKVKIDQKRRRRSKLRLVLRLKKQTLQTLQLTYEAVQLESEAFATSATQALRYVDSKEAIHVMVQLNQEQYESLKREASEQTSLAEWRISVSVEEKIAAENSRDSAFRRMQILYPRNNLGRSNMREQIIHKERNELKTEGKANNREGSKSNHKHLSKLQGKPPTGVNKTYLKQFKNSSYGYLVEKKKSSICVRIKKFFVRRVSKYFK